MKTRYLLLPALLGVACGSAGRGDAARLAAAAARLGPARTLAPLALRANLPLAARVEDLSREGFPRRVGVTSVQPELIFEIDEVDDLSPTYAEIVRLGTASIVPGDWPQVRREEKREDGTFSVVIEHAARTGGGQELKTFTVDMRVAVGKQQFDCSGTATNIEAAERIEETCAAMRAL